MNKEELFRKLYKNLVKRNEWYNKLPIDIAMAFANNDYVAALDDDNSIMIDYIFGDVADSINWFLYQWAPGYEIGYDDKVEKIMDIDQHISWMKKHEGFK